MRGRKLLTTKTYIELWKLYSLGEIRFRLKNKQSMLLSLQAKISANILISPFLYVSLHSLLADMAQLVEQRIRNG